MPLYRGGWYSQAPAFGWFDQGDKPGSNALGVPDWQQGIALPSRKTLGQWFNVTPPGATIPYPFQQTDVGPSKWTGRGTDISAAAAQQMGYTPQNFPTDAGFKIEPRDEPRGLGSPAGLPVQAGDLPDNATGGDAYASGPSSAPARKSMPSSLMDMFQPTDAGGQPTDFGKALASRSNSLIGLGLGLMSPSWPGQGSIINNALQGYQAGASTDAQNAYRQQLLAHQKTQDARQAAQDLFNRQMAEKQFTQSTLTPFQKMQSDIAKGGPAAEQFYASQLGNVPSIQSIDDPNNPGDKISVLFNPRAPAGQQITRINAPGSGGTAGPDPFAGAANPLAPGSTAQAPSRPSGPGAVYGQGPGGYSTTQPSMPFAPAGAALSGQGPVEAKTMREARAKAVIANEEDAVKSARAAAEFKPALDEMARTYEALVKAGGIGSVQGKAVPRALQAITGYGGANEDLRQQYETAKGKVSALVTAAQNKGEGAVSNYERQMFGAQFPALDAINGATQLPFLKQLQASTEQAINVGSKTSLGAAPGTYTRPSVERPGTGSTASDPLAEARSAISQGAPKAKVIERLAKQGIRFNPKDLD